MAPPPRLSQLTTVVGSFHAHVLAARLGGEGILVELRGLSDGPYPLISEVAVLVRADQLALARELLLEDAVDAAFDERYDDLESGRTDGLDLPPVEMSSGVHPRPMRRALVFAMIALVLVVGVVAAYH